MLSTEAPNGARNGVEIATDERLVQKRDRTCHSGSTENDITSFKPSRQSTRHFRPSSARSRVKPTIRSPRRGGRRRGRRGCRGRTGNGARAFIVQNSTFVRRSLVADLGRLGSGQLSVGIAGWDGRRRYRSGLHGARVRFVARAAGQGKRTRKNQSHQDRVCRQMHPFRSRTPRENGSRKAAPIPGVYARTLTGLDTMESDMGEPNPHFSHPFVARRRRAAGMRGALRISRRSMVDTLLRSENAAKRSGRAAMRLRSRNGVRNAG